MEIRDSAKLKFEILQFQTQMSVEKFTVSTTYWKKICRNWTGPSCFQNRFQKIFLSKFRTISVQNFSKSFEKRVQFCAHNMPPSVDKTTPKSVQCRSHTWTEQPIYSTNITKKLKKYETILTFRTWRCTTASCEPLAFPKPLLATVVWRPIYLTYHAFYHKFYCTLKP